MSGTGITLDLNGNTVTYDNATPVTFTNQDFESGNTGWDLSGAAAAAIGTNTFIYNRSYNAAMTDNKSVKFTLPAADQYLVSTGTVTLLANTQYSFSAMFNYGNGNAYTPNSTPVTGYVKLVGTGGETTRTASWAATNTRGMQFVETVFTTGGSNETYNVRVGISGGASAAAIPFFIDDIKIQRYKCYGMDVGATSFHPTNSRITNGTIIQGSDSATWGHGVVVDTANGLVVDNCNITVNGTNASCICSLNTGVFTSTIHHNTLTSNILTTSDRNNKYGAMIFQCQGTIHDNILTGGALTGIWTKGAVGSTVYNNTISLKTRYTNAFALDVGGPGELVHDNIINCHTGVYTGRGILSSGSPNSTICQIFNNTVNVQGVANNQEYNGAQLGGVYGIQIENGKNVEVYNNTVTAYGNNGVAAYAYRQNTDSGTTGTGAAKPYIHNNTFQAISDGTTNASATKITGVGSGGDLPITDSNLQFEDNALLTNDGFCQSWKDATVTLNRCTLTATSQIASPLPFTSDFPSTGSWVTLNNMPAFLDTVFHDSQTNTYFSAATCRRSPAYGGTVTTAQSFVRQWTTTVHVKDGSNNPVVGVAVTVTDKNGTAVFSGNTDASGNTVGICNEFITNGSTKTNYSLFTATSGSQSSTFTADAIKTITLTAPGGGVAPTIISSSSLSATENTTTAGTILATGDATITYAITGGADQAKFSIGSTSGLLTFNTAPDFETPTDANTDNTYLVSGTAVNGAGTTPWSVAVTVTNAQELIGYRVRVSGQTILRQAVTQ